MLVREGKSGSPARIVVDGVAAPVKTSAKPMMHLVPVAFLHRTRTRVAVAGLMMAAMCAPGMLSLRAQSGPPGKQEPEPKELAAPLPRGKKLFLKDGTFQIVREYERRGERVRYYSMERSAWEELPTDLIDWDATEKAAAEEAAQLGERTQRIREQQMAERVASIDVDTSIELGGGMFLPDDPGMFVHDGELLLPLDQVQVEIKLNKGRLLTQILIPIPIIPTKHRVQIPGRAATARVGSHPEFYIRTTDDREPELELLRAQVKGGNREVDVISTNVVGQQASERKIVSMQRWKVARRVWRFTMSQTLEPGEYALAEVVSEEGVNLFVWDFGVDRRPAAPGK